jgi:hypothetical protein
MASLRQIAANRRNSQKSTGPRTAAGKSLSSFNALKTGIYSNALIIRAENVGELENLTAEFHALYQPVAADVNTGWLLRRMRRCEAQLWERELARIRKHDPHDDTALASAFSQAESEFRTLQARLTALDRTFHRALTALVRLQKSRLEQPAPPQPEDPEPVTPQLASFPKNPCEAPSLEPEAPTPSPSEPTELSPQPLTQTPDESATSYTHRP